MRNNAARMARPHKMIDPSRHGVVSGLMRPHARHRDTHPGWPDIVLRPRRCRAIDSPQSRDRHTCSGSRRRAASDTLPPVPPRLATPVPAALRLEQRRSATNSTTHIADGQGRIPTEVLFPETSISVHPTRRPLERMPSHGTRQRHWASLRRPGLLCPAGGEMQRTEEKRVGVSCRATGAKNHAKSKESSRRP